MTDKRFHMIIEDVEGNFYYLDKDTGEKITSTLELENKLNALHEENHELECEREKLMYANEDLLEQKRSWEECSDNYAKLYQENEQLKQEIETLQEQIVHFDIGDVE